MSVTELTTPFGRADVDADVAPVMIRGDLDLATAPWLRRVIIEAQAAPGVRGTVVIDMSGVTFIDACGIGVLVSAHKRARARGGQLVLRDPSRCVSRLLELTGLALVFLLDLTTP
jgi:anti-sigma B factor antagonist